MNKTTLRKLISEVKFTNQTESSPDWETLSNIFSIWNLSYSNDDRLKAYFIKKWYCTDSYVGLRTYFLDGEFVAISGQSSRKSDEEFTFMSKECAEKVRLYLISLVHEEKEIHVDILDEDELDEEIPGTFKIQYNTQIIDKTALLNGQRVDIIRTRYDFNKEPDKYFHCVEIKKENGDKEEVNVQDLDFEYNV